MYSYTSKKSFTNLIANETKLEEKNELDDVLKESYSLYLFAFERK